MNSSKQQIEIKNKILQSVEKFMPNEYYFGRLSGILKYIVSYGRLNYAQYKNLLDIINETYDNIIRNYKPDKDLDSLKILCEESAWTLCNCQLDMGNYRFLQEKMSDTLSKLVKK